jgi:DMSO/TMAO reductase YedYZ molybdopterin-dependent catalytic subunit
MPSETRVATLECAGNSRVFLVPHAEGVQWELGAVGNAEWTGVPLVTLLERAGMEESACEILFEGADHGTPKEMPAPPVPISYARSLRLRRVRRSICDLHPVRRLGHKTPYVKALMAAPPQNPGIYRFLARMGYFPFRTKASSLRSNCLEGG